jgi:hypothetical protein
MVISEFNSRRVFLTKIQDSIAIQPQPQHRAQYSTSTVYGFMITVRWGCPLSRECGSNGRLHVFFFGRMRFNENWNGIPASSEVVTARAQPDPTRRGFTLHIALGFDNPNPTKELNKIRLEWLSIRRIRLDKTLFGSKSNNSIISTYQPVHWGSISMYYL